MRHKVGDLVAAEEDDSQVIYGVVFKEKDLTYWVMWADGFSDTSLPYMTYDEYDLNDYKKTLKKELRKCDKKKK